MANTSEVRAKIDADLKANAEEILSELGITPSGAIQMLYSQIVITRSMPFELRDKPLAVGDMSDEELAGELKKGLDSIKSGKGYSAKKADEYLARELGI